MPKSPDEVANIRLAFQCSEDEAKTAEYLGDGVYATHDGYQVWLRTYNGVTVHDAIALEPAVLAELESFVTAFRERAG